MPSARVCKVSNESLPRRLLISSVDIASSPSKILSWSRSAMLSRIPPAEFLAIVKSASSVILTQLYLENVINMATMISGLLVGAGVGILILCKVNKNAKENIKIITLLYCIGVISGLIIQAIGIQ